MTTIILYLVNSSFWAVVGAYGFGVIGILIFLFTPAWIPGRFRNIAGIVGVCMITGGSAYWFAFHQGEKFMARKIAARDAAALQQVEEGQKEVNDCNGGVNWNVVTGTCDN